MHHLFDIVKIFRGYKNQSISLYLYTVYFRTFYYFFIYFCNSTCSFFAWYTLKKLSSKNDAWCFLFSKLWAIKIRILNSTFLQKGTQKPNCSLYRRLSPNFPCQRFIWIVCPPEKFQIYLLLQIPNRTAFPFTDFPTYYVSQA